MFYKFVSFLILSTPTDTLGIFAREQYFELLTAVIFEKGIAQRLGHMELQLHSSYIGKKASIMQWYQRFDQGNILKVSKGVRAD